MLSKKILIDEDEGIIAMDSHHKQPVRPSNAEITLIENYANLAQLGIEHNLDRYGTDRKRRTLEIRAGRK